MSNTVPRLFSQTGTATAMQLEVQGASGTPNSRSASLSWRAPGKSLSDLHFLRSWIESTTEKTTGPRTVINWYRLAGLLLVIGVSLGFWAGVGLLLMRLWK